MGADDALVDRVRRGEGAAWREVYELLSPKVVGYLASRGVSDPSDLAQEVFLQVFQKAPTVRGGVSGLRTFVFSVAHARMVDHFRTTARRPVLVQHMPALTEEREPSAEQSVVDREALARAMQLLDPLTEDQRDVIAMRVIAELSIEETAQALGRTPGSVKQLQRRGIESLRTNMGREARP